jgi:hypothetical protein
MACPVVLVKHVGGFNLKASILLILFECITWFNGRLTRDFEFESGNSEYGDMTFKHQGLNKQEQREIER